MSFLENIQERFANAAEEFERVITTAQNPEGKGIEDPQFISDVKQFKLAAILISKQELTVTNIFMGSYFYVKSEKADKFILGPESGTEIYAMGNIVKIGETNYYSNEVVELNGGSYLLKVIPNEKRVEVNYYGEK